jgi:hypothetical protein
MDPYTDVLAAFLSEPARISLSDIVTWLIEWAEQGAPAHLLCRAEEWGTPLCNQAIDHAYAFGYTFRILVP